MAKDLRRADLRTNVRVNPFWIVSAEFGCASAGGQAILFDFPLVHGDFFIHEVVCSVSTAFTDVDGVVKIGYGTLTESGVLTEVDDDRYMVATEITANVAALYFGGLATFYYFGVSILVTGAEWAAARVKGDLGHGGVMTSLAITGADYEALPVVYATVKANQLVGTARLRMLVSSIQ